MAGAAATVAVAATDRAGSKGRLNHRCHGSAIGEGVVVMLEGGGGEEEAWEGTSERDVGGRGSS